MIKVEVGNKKANVQIIGEMTADDVILESGILITALAEAMCKPESPLSFPSIGVAIADISTFAAVYADSGAIDDFFNDIIETAEIKRKIEKSHEEPTGVNVEVKI